MVAVINSIRRIMMDSEDWIFLSIVLCLVIFHGEPDLVDAVIHKLMEE